MNPFLHIGEKVLLNSGEVLGIFRAGAGTENFIKNCGTEGALRNTRDNYRSFVLVKRAGKNLVYQSKISSRRLIMRMINPEVIDGKSEKSEEAG